MQIYIYTAIQIFKYMFMHLFKYEIIRIFIYSNIHLFYFLRAWIITRYFYKKKAPDDCTP